MPVYLLTNEATDTYPLWKMLETNPAPSADLTSSVVFPKNSDVMDIVEPGVEVTATLTSLPTTFSQKGWRTESKLNGDFDAGTWIFECVLDGGKYAGVDITLHARLWKSADPSGAGAVAISNWISSPTQYIDHGQTDVVFSWSVSLGSVSLSNEYLFIEFCLDVGPTLSSKAAGATILFTCDETPDTTTREQLTTPPFTAAAIEITIADSGTGTDTVSEISVSLTLTDSGAGTDVIAVSQFIFISISDSGSSVDAISEITVQLNVSDTGTGTDTIVEIVARLTVSDVSIGSDVIAITGFLAVVDSGSGVDAVSTSIGVAITDGGIGTDSIAAITAGIFLADTGTGTDAVSAITVRLAASDSGAGVDAVATSAALLITDAGSGVDAMITGIQINITETGVAADAIATLNRLRITDGLTGTDTLAEFSIYTQLVETGVGTDALTEMKAKCQTQETCIGLDSATMLCHCLCQETGTHLEALYVEKKEAPKPPPPHGPTAPPPVTITSYVEEYPIAIRIPKQFTRLYRIATRIAKPIAFTVPVRMRMAKLMKLEKALKFIPPQPITETMSLEILKHYELSSLTDQELITAWKAISKALAKEAKS